MTKYSLHMCGLASVVFVSATNPIYATNVGGGNALITLQGSGVVSDGFDETHSGPGANFFQDLGEGAIYNIASDWAGGHTQFPTTAWPTSDGVIGWNFGTGETGPSVKNSADEFVFWDAGNSSYVFYEQVENANPSHQPLFYQENDQRIGTLSFGNDGITPGTPFISDRQHVVLSEFDLQSAQEAISSGKQLVSATFTFWIDDVIDMGLTGSQFIRLPTQAFVNVYEGDGDLTNFQPMQDKFERSDLLTADAVVDLKYIDNGGQIESGGVVFDVDPIGEQRITDFIISRAFQLEGIEIFQFDLDVKDAIDALLQSNSEFAGIALGATDDGDFGLASVDSVVRDSVTDEVLENYLPMLTLEFADVLLGDLNGDGVLTDSDVSAFVMALTDPAAYELAYAGIDPNVVGDFSGDGVLSNGDISGFAAALDAATAAVPEPASITILGAAALLLTRRRRQHV